MNSPAALAASRFYNASRAMDAEAWSDLFSEDGVVEDPVGSPPQTGREAIRAFFAGLLGRFETFGLTEEHVFVAGDAAAVKWTARGVTRAGRSLSFEGIDLLRVDAAGRIRSLQGYWDPARFLALVEAEPSMDMGGND